MALPAPLLRRDLVGDLDTGAETATTAVAARITQGLPHRIALTPTLTLLLVVPTGQAHGWRDAPPETVVASSAWQLTRPGDPDAVPARPVPARLVLLAGGAAVAATPLVLGRLVPLTSGADRTRVLVQVRATGWALHAGTLVGPGDHGSVIRLGWRELSGGGPA